MWGHGLTVNVMRQSARDRSTDGVVSGALVLGERIVGAV